MAFPGRRKEERVASALERQAATATQTPKQRLDALDERLGVGVGAVRERAKLQAKLTPTGIGKQSKSAQPDKIVRSPLAGST